MGTGAEPIIRVDTDPAVRGEVEQQRDALLALVTQDPAATMHLEHAGAAVAGTSIGRLHHIELDRLLAVGRERNVALRRHAVAATHDDREQDV